MSIGINHYIEERDGESVLICPNAEIKKILYRSATEEKLSEKLKDRDRAQQIYTFFEESITGSIGSDRNLAEEWSKCLVDNAYILGENIEFMREALSHYSDKIKKFFSNHPLECKNFLESISNHERGLNKKIGSLRLSDTRRTVVILVSSSGGGHKTAAEALKGLAYENGYEAVVLNQDELTADTDPLFVAKTTYKNKSITTAEVYNRVFQQDDDLQTANKLWGIGNHLREYIENNQMKALVEKIRGLATVHIFSLATHHPEHSILPHATNISLTYIHTDFDFNKALHPIVKKINLSLIDFWINAGDNEVLTNEELEEPKQDGTLDLWEKTLTNEDLEQLQHDGTIVVSGYPVREAFRRETNIVQINKLKEELGIDLAENVALLSMGRQGIASHIKKYVSLLISPENNVKDLLHIVVICGKNQPLEHDLLSLLGGLSKDQINPNVRFSIRGFLENDEMANYYKVADVLISKPGGATTAEAVQMGVPMLCCNAHQWEKTNERYLIRHGLGAHLESDDSFVDQLSSLINRKKEGIEYRPIDWKRAMNLQFGRMLTPGKKIFTDGIAKRLGLQEATLLYDTFKELHNLFEKNSIWYSLMSGSLLGAVRHKGIIPWDDDGDIFVKEEDIEKLLSLKNELSKQGYDLYKSKEGWYKVASKDAKRADGSYFPELDIFPMKQDGERFVHGNDFARSCWHKEFFASNEVSNMKLWNFGKLKLWGPSDGKRYLDEMYGESWQDTGYLIWDHDKGSKHKDKRMFKIMDYSCAQALPKSKKGHLIEHQALAKTDLETMTNQEMDDDWKLDTYFGNIRVINLREQEEKYRICITNLQEIGLKEGDIERFNAIVGRDLPRELWDRMQSTLDRDTDKLHQGQTGCYMSHYLVIKEAKARYDNAKKELKEAKAALQGARGSGHGNLPDLERQLRLAEEKKRKYSSTLVIEDDNKFGRVTNAERKEFTLKNVGRVFREAMLHLPKDWDSILFSALEIGSKGRLRFDPKRRVKKLVYAYESNAYAISSKYYEKVIKALEKINNPQKSLLPVDIELAKIMDTNKVYVATPPLAFQGGFESTIRAHGRKLPFVQRNIEQWDRMGDLVSSIEITEETKHVLRSYLFRAEGSVCPPEVEEIEKGWVRFSGKEGIPILHAATKATSWNNIFFLKSAPGLIFKCFSPRKMRERFEMVQNARRVCREKGYDCLIIPDNKIITISNGRKRIQVWVEKIVEINPYDDVQKELWYSHSESLDRAIKQLCEAASLIKYTDIAYRNSPVYHEMVNGQPVYRKIALVDIEDHSFKTCISSMLMNEQQARRLFGDEKAMEVMARVEKHEQLLKFHRHRGIVGGNEEIVIDISSIDFSGIAPNIDEAGSIGHTAVRECLEKLIRDMNNFFRTINPSELQNTVQGRRYLLIQPGQQGQDNSYESFDTALKSKDLWESHDKSCLEAALQKLLEEGVLFEVSGKDKHGYYVQA
jgi:UDP-N-acetylglucosamine:LPS N-acetylglucosamine transferase/GR25 family glycosyltransferase involved in LPS biosynthesis